MAGRRGGPGRQNVRIPPDGQIRVSQVVSTFGPGSLVDLIDSAVLMSGLDFWTWPREKGPKLIEEPRLRDAIAERFQRAGRRPLSVEAPFREPPMGDDKEPRKGVGILAQEFPWWFVCQECRTLVQANVLDKKGNGYTHSCTKKGAQCVPVRFVGMCKRGHLEEIPWIAFAHIGARTCAAPALRLLEGATGDISEITVSCACGASQKLSTALAPDALPWCAGKRPWLGQEGNDLDEDGQTNCDQRLTLRSRTASNAYFSQVMSALSIPEKGQELFDAVKSVWDVLVAVTHPSILVGFRNIPKVATALEKWPDDAEVMGAIEAVRADEGPVRKSLRSAEYEVLMGEPPEQPGDLPAWDEPYFARRFVPGSNEQLPAKVGGLVLAHKLREVRAQVGFTRIDHASPDLEGEYDLGVSSAPLTLLRNWLPAIEVSGEGVLVALDEEAVQEWEQRAEVFERGEDLLAGYDAWAARNRPKMKRGAQAPPPAPFPGVRFYLLHSLSHLLITAISLECGYAASAIRERIYCARRDSAQPMAAVLLSTGTSGAEGTLGGLIGQGRRLRAHLQRAWDLGRLCSNDPVCAHHTPKEDLGERYLEGAACHGCLFVAESSCERFNQYLDRSLVVPTIGRPARLAFFEERP